MAKKKPNFQTALVMSMFRKQGFVVDKTEYWNHFAKIRKDLFGFIDLIAMKPGEPLIAVQVTSRSMVSSRVKKILELPEHKIWLSTGCRIWVIGLPRIVEIK